MILLDFTWQEWQDEECHEDELALVRLCHPDRDERDETWWHTHPTIFFWKDKQPVGYTSFVCGPGVMWGYDLGVHPDYRRQGLATALLAQRTLLGAGQGCHLFLGMTQPSNIAMRTIFKRAACEEGEWIQEHYQDVMPHVDGIPVVGGEEHLEWAKAQKPWRERHVLL